MHKKIEVNIYLDRRYWTARFRANSCNMMIKTNRWSIKAKAT